MRTTARRLGIEVSAHTRNTDNNLSHYFSFIGRQKTTNVLTSPFTLPPQTDWAAFFLLLLLLLLWSCSTSKREFSPAYVYIRSSCYPEDTNDVYTIKIHTIPQYKISRNSIILQVHYDYSSVLYVCIWVCA